MALEEIGERLGALGWIGAGLGAVILVPKVVPALARGLRPVAKGTIKGCMALTDKTREVIAETHERWHDLVAEARAEHEGRVDEARSDADAEPASGAASGEEIATVSEARSEAEEPKSKPRPSRKSEQAAPEAA